MMKLGEEANRLSRLGVLAPDGVEWILWPTSSRVRYEREGFTVERIESSPTGNPALGVVWLARPLGCIR